MFFQRLAIGGVFLIATAAVADPLGPLASAAQRLKIPDAALSVLVQAIDSPTPLLSVNAEMPRNPASTIKLLTTFVALDLLGPTYSWPTEIYTLGSIKDGVLTGDLVLRGQGDPFLVVENMWKMLGELRARGLREITGDLIIDDTYFAPVAANSGEFDGEAYRLYNVLPNALLVNFKAITFAFAPSADARSVNIRVDPALPNLIIENHLRLVPGHCHGVLSTFQMSVPDPVAADRVVFSGDYQASCGEQSLPRTLLQPASYTFGLFKLLWAQWGGALNGGLKRGPAPLDAPPFYRWDSPPLAEVVRPLNKWSNNVMADAFLYAIGGSAFKPPLTAAQGVAVVQRYLVERKIPTAGLVLENGSGLSRNTRISAHTLSEVLRYAYGSRYMPEYLASLSIVGVDGTTRKRFPRAPETGWMHLKTGHINGVAAIAGYVRAKSGRMYSVAFLANHPRMNFWSGNVLSDALLRWVYQH